VPGICVGRPGKIRSLKDEQRARLAPRNHLYREFLLFVEVLKPLCFVMENVPQLATYDEGRVAARIREDFERLEYDVGVSGMGDPWLRKAERYGVPQTRQRFFSLVFGADSQVRYLHPGQLTKPQRCGGSPTKEPIASNYSSARGPEGGQNCTFPDLARSRTQQPICRV
jgi:site-specific DNA-cytosine methylase